MVDRCICESRTFTEILRIATEEGLTTIQDCRERKLCATGCELCVPYVEQTLKTGQVRFTVQSGPIKPI